MNQMARPPLPAMTTDEFLAWPGDDSGRKFHLIDGEVWPMSPASRIHGDVQANLAYLMGAATRAARNGLRVVTEGAIIPALHADDNVRVPDVVVGPISRNTRDQIFEGPVVPVEILSPGNKAITRNNVLACATLPSVREIVVVHTSRTEAEISRRDHAGGWQPKPEIIKPGGRFALASIALDCPVGDVYAETSLTEDGSRG